MQSFTWVSRTNGCMDFYLFNVCFVATCPEYTTVLDNVTLMVFKNSTNCTHYEIVPSLVTFSLLYKHILLVVLLSGTFSPIIKKNR
jgi:hypothetical protein